MSWGGFNLLSSRWLHPLSSRFLQPYFRLCFFDYFNVSLAGSSSFMLREVAPDGKRLLFLKGLLRWLSPLVFSGCLWLSPGCLPAVSSACLWLSPGCLWLSPLAVSGCLLNCLLTGRLEVGQQESLRDGEQESQRDGEEGMGKRGSKGWGQEEQQVSLRDGEQEVLLRHAWRGGARGVAQTEGVGEGGQEALLRQILLAGLVDRVARRDPDYRGRRARSFSPPPSWSLSLSRQVIHSCQAVISLSWSFSPPPPWSFSRQVILFPGHSRRARSFSPPPPWVFLFQSNANLRCTLRHWCGALPEQNTTALRNKSYSGVLPAQRQSRQPAKKMC